MLPKWQDCNKHAKPVQMPLQSNHRSWADFYLDVVATDGNAQMLSRMAVALAFPMFMGAVCVIRSVVLFSATASTTRRRVPALSTRGRVAACVSRNGRC